MSDSDIADLWKNHYTSLFSSVNDSQSKELFCERVCDVASSGTCLLNYDDVINAISEYRRISLLAQMA